MQFKLLIFRLCLLATSLTVSMNVNSGPESAGFKNTNLKAMAIALSNGKLFFTNNRDDEKTRAVHKIGIIPNNSQTQTQGSVVFTNGWNVDYLDVITADDSVDNVIGRTSANNNVEIWSYPNNNVESNNLDLDHNGWYKQGLLNNVAVAISSRNAQFYATVDGQVFRIQPNESTMLTSFASHFAVSADANPGLWYVTAANTVKQRVNWNQAAETDVALPDLTGASIKAFAVKGRVDAFFMIIADSSDKLHVRNSQGVWKTAHIPNLKKVAINSNGDIAITQGNETDNLNLVWLSHYASLINNAANISQFGAKITMATVASEKIAQEVDKVVVAVESKITNLTSGINQAKEIVGKVNIAIDVLSQQLELLKNNFVADKQLLMDAIQSVNASLQNPSVPSAQPVQSIAASPQNIVPEVLTDLIEVDPSLVGAQSSREFPNKTLNSYGFFSIDKMLLFLPSVVDDLNSNFSYIIAVKDHKNISRLNINTLNIEELHPEAEGNNIKSMNVGIDGYALKVDVNYHLKRFNALAPSNSPDAKPIDDMSIIAGEPLRRAILQKISVGFYNNFFGFDSGASLLLKFLPKKLPEINENAFYYIRSNGTPFDSYNAIQSFAASTDGSVWYILQQDNKDLIKRCDTQGFSFKPVGIMRQEDNKPPVFNEPIPPEILQIKSVVARGTKDNFYMVILAAERDGIFYPFIRNRNGDWHKINMIDISQFSIGICGTVFLSQPNWAFSPTSGTRYAESINNYIAAQQEWSNPGRNPIVLKGGDYPAVTIVKRLKALPSLSDLGQEAAAGF